MTTDTWVTPAINLIETKAGAGRQVIPGRYPYTYACDYVRSHPTEFGVNPQASRAEISGLIRSRLNEERVCAELADAYIREHGLVWPTEHTCNQPSGHDEEPTP